jgi:DNA-binding IclR family transcriptional regulator
MSTEQPNKHWTFLTNHTQVLLCIAEDSEARLRDIAQTVGITERAAQRIAADLVDAGVLERRRIGRRNHYLINRDAAMRHAAQAEQHIGPLLDLLTDRRPSPSASAPVG